MSGADQRHPFSGPDFGGSTTAMMRTPLTDAQISAAARCPRCGYDMNGELAEWSKRGECSVESTCPECGFRITWRFLLNPAFVERIQSFELTRQRLLQAWLRTCVKVLWPPALWREIRLELPLGLLRVCLGVMAGSVAAQLVLALGIEVIGRLAYSGWNATLWIQFSSNETVWDWLSFAFPAPWALRGEASWWIIDWVCIGLVAAVLPISFVLAPSTLRRCKVRPEAFVRIVGYLPLAVYIWVGVVGLLVVVEQVFQLFGGFWQYPRTRAAVTPISALVVIWVWWALACRDYLKLPRPWLIATAFMLIAMGVVLLIAVLTGQAVPFAERWLA